MNLFSTKIFFEAACYARLTPGQRQAKLDPQRATWQNATLSERGKESVHQRACRQRMTHDERQDLNTCRRSARQSLSPNERKAPLDWWNASHAVRRDTPCLESIATQYPNSRASFMVKSIIITQPPWCRVPTTIICYGWR